MCRHGTKQAILIFELGKNRVICEWKTHQGLWRANHHSLFSGSVIIKMFICFQIQIFVWSCMLKLQLLIVLLQLSQVTWWLTKKSHVFFFFFQAAVYVKRVSWGFFAFFGKSFPASNRKIHVSEHRGPVPASVNGQEDLYYEHTLQLMKLLAYHIHMFCAWKIRFISKIIVRNIKYIFHIHLDNVSLIWKFLCSSLLTINHCHYSFIRHKAWLLL